MRLGIFGGTFDPPHVGHLIAAQEIHHQLALDQLLIIPAAVPPHKRDREVTSAAVRLEMTTAAFAGDDRFRVSDVEVRREGASYTVDTLRALRDEWPDAELVLAMGADQAAELGTWKEPEAIRRLATVAAFAREGQAVPEGWEGPVVPVPFMEISSTEIRRRVAAGEPVSYLVAEPVEAIIRREGLYRDT
jgi:nicotinate-nucleotide adenylyltransferase